MIKEVRTHKPELKKNKGVQSTKRKGLKSALSQLLGMNSDDLKKVRGFRFLLVF